MSTRNLVLEINETDTPLEIQDRLNQAAEDGFFLVNVVGRLAFLRTAVSQKKPDSMRGPNRDGKDEDGKEGTALDIIKANLKLKVEEIIPLLLKAGIDRSESWVQKKRKKLRETGTSGVILASE
jgi:hypothetical protein